VSAWFLGLFLLFSNVFAISHVDLMFCHCVLLNEAMALVFLASFTV
jgi:hypothetical protein